MNCKLTTGMRQMLTTALMAACVSTASAATHRYDVLIDADNRTTTGCTVATARGNVAGIDQIVRALVDTTTTTATVASLQQLQCVGASSFSAPLTLSGAPYPLALAGGTGGTTAVEFRLPLAAIPLNADRTQPTVVRLAALSLAADGSADTLLPLTPLQINAGAPLDAELRVVIPTLTQWALSCLALMLALIGVCLIRRHGRHALHGGLRAVLAFGIGLSLFSLGGAIAYAITLDGLVSDWAGSSPLLTGARGDAVGSATGSADLVALYAKVDGSDLSMRVDADVRLAPVAATNLAPLVSAGAAQTLTLPSATGAVVATLGGTASDDGLPNPPAALAVNWSKLSGPGAVSFANPSLASTTASIATAGTYVLRLSASDSLLTSTADVTITVNPFVPGNQAPVISGLVATINLTLPTNAVLLAPTVTDDGLPSPPAALTYAWSKVSGGSVTFSAASSSNTTATFAASVGSYVLRLTVSDSVLSASQDVTVNVGTMVVTNLAPVVNAGANQSITLPAQASLGGSATDDGLPNPPAKLMTYWSVLSGPSTPVTFVDPARAATNATFSAPGTYVLRLTATDGALTTSSDTQVSVTDGAPVLAAIPDQTINLGTRLQQLLVAADGNVNDTLTYSLSTAPSGAALRPAPLIDWLPTVAQLGAHTFTARVADSAGQSASTSFAVTVVHTNRAPTLATQANVIQVVGTPFVRLLQATDLDAGDSLTFGLVTGPAGMTLNGATLDWSTVGKAPGDYTVSVKVTDAGGLSDSRQFSITLTQAAPPPITRGDTYTVKIGQTLNVAAAGVLGNDDSPSGRSLTATKLSDPTKGTLNSFNANGSFSYTAPATLPPRALNPVVKFRGNNYGSTVFQYAADLDRDGKADYVSNDFGNIRAWRGTDGSQIWQFDSSIATNVDLTGCQFFAFWGEHALGDVSGNGEIDLIMPISCTKDVSTNADRLVAINTSAISPTGKVAARWLSPQLSKPHPGAYTSPVGSPLPNPPIHPLIDGSAYRTLPTLAKITPTGGTKVLLRKLWTSTEGAYFATPALGTYTYAACRTATGLVADEGRPCKATYVLDASTGAVEHLLIAPNNADERQIDNGPTSNSPTIIADLDGDGQVEIISGGDVWKLVNGSWTLAWQALFESNAGFPKAFEPDSVAVADLDGDGKAEVIMHVLPTGNTGVQYYGWIYIFSHDGVLKRKIPLEHTLPGLVSVGDVDGDGVPEIMLTLSGMLYVYRSDGSLLWAKELTDDVTGVTPVINPLAPALRSNNSPVYVYDLDLDGVPEVILQGSRRLFIFDGRTGAELWSIDLESENHTNSDTPMLVDADGDGRIDIVVNTGGRWNCILGGGPVACKGGTFTISGGDLNWAPGPKVQNQLNFRASAINDSAVIRYDASVRRDFRQQIQQGTVIDPRIAQGTSFTYKANDGVADSAPATVQIDIKPLNRPPVITSIPPTAFSEAGLTGSQTVYTITAFDPDPGDTVRYEYVASQGRLYFSQPPAVDPVTGAVSVLVCGAPCGARPVTIVVAAVDSFGARTEQSMIINFTPTVVVVPNVIGQPVASARAVLELVPLTPLILAEVFNSAVAGTVLAQDPLAGTPNVPVAGAVRLTVSKGPAPTLVPFVVGDSLAVANGKLAARGYSRAVVAVFSTTIPVNQVIAQAPDGGTQLLPIPANPVSLTVSAGPPLALPIASIVLEPGPGPLLRLAGDELQYKAIAVFSDGTSADITLTAAWASTTAAAATVDVVGLAKAINNGSTTISASLGGKTGSALLSVASRVLGDNTPPTAAITSPADGGAVNGPTAIIGIASDTNFLRYELAIALAGDNNYTVLAEGSAAVTNGVLGMLDPTTMVNDLYELRLTVFDRSQNATVVTSTVQLKGNRKVGLFTLTYQDLNVPAAGIPLTAHRTYDSRDKTKGDFGIGWRLGLQTLRIRANRALGTGWVRNVSGINVSLVATSGHWVSVTLPDGRVEEFDMVVSPTSNIGSLDATTVTGFTPRAGTLGKLQALGNNSLLIVSGGAVVELVDDTTLNTYSPQLYRYTMLDGTQIEISPNAGVKKVTDRNGNAISFGPNGILHSDGRGIVFARDAKDRIVSITDLMGNVQNYTYDGNGDLVNHTDALGAVSTFSYDRNHGLIEIRNALGVRAARNDYDASGRLIAMTDADGKQITITHNTASNEEVVTDRLGNSSRVLYDDNGNVLSSQKSVTIAGTLVSAVTTTTYDTQGNETSVTDPDGLRHASTYSGVLPLTQVVDPTGLNLSTAFAYNPRNDVTTAADPGGRAFNFGYDANGNLTSFDSPLAGAGSALTGAQGLPSQRTDALGYKTNLTYDAAGRMTREENLDASNTLLRRMDFAYDANGNKISATAYRTVGAAVVPLTTRYGYNAANRLGSVTDPLGGVSRTEYDANARVTATADALGRRTVYGYDTLGRLSRTTYPDGTFESSTFDADGAVIASTDKAGRTTAFAYDELKRLVKSTLPTGSFTQTIYSAGGRTVATIDGNGNRTEFAYDTAGRRTSTQLPAVANGTSASPLVRPQVTATLSPLGTPISATDANGRVTTFQYDIGGRPSQTTHPDGSTTRQTYDPLGRRTSVTNEEGQTTNYSYDGLGRLIAVSGLAGDATYAYDQVGSLLTQTDALGRVTRFTYDALGRMIEKTYPGGDTERNTYDAVGHLVSSTDGLSRTTTFSYDVMSRLTSKTLPGGVTVSYTYNPDGQRLSVTDIRGITRYSYDINGRLASVVHPTGETISYSRDANGNLLSVTSPTATVSYGYDALNRLSQVTAPEGQSFAYYDLSGNRVRQTAANGIVTDATFNARNRPTLLTHSSASSSVLQSYATVYSAAGRRTRIAELDGSVENYTYDVKGRLASETRTGTQPRANTYSYDAVGNRLQAVRSGTPTAFSYNSNDQLLSDGAASYTWDANGNLATKAQAATLTQYGFDAENRLRSINGGGLANAYAYDADGNRVQASAVGSTSRFLVDNSNNTGLSQVLEERDGSGALQARYSYGNELLAMARGATPSFLSRDAFGSIRSLTSAAAATTDQYQYDAYGTTVSATGSTVNPYRYRGERFDADSGLYQLRARYYDSAQGRFNSRDPYPGEASLPISLHRNLYANGDPVNFSDPTGLITLPELSVASYLNTVIDGAQFLQTVGKGCTAYSTTEQVADWIFAASALTHMLLAVNSAQKSFSDGQIKKIGAAVKADAILFAIENKKVASGGLKKIAVSATGGGGKSGIKASFEKAGANADSSSAVEFNVTGPPLTVAGAAGGKLKVFERIYTACGFEAAKIQSELNLKAYGGYNAGGGLSSELSLKFDLFHGRFSTTLPILGVDFNGGRGTMGVTILGVALTFGL